MTYTTKLSQPSHISNIRLIISSNHLKKKNFLAPIKKTILVWQSTSSPYNHERNEFSNFAPLSRARACVKSFISVSVGLIAAAGKAELELIRSLGDTAAAQRNYNIFHSSRARSRAIAPAVKISCTDRSADAPRGKRTLIDRRSTFASLTFFSIRF